MKQLQILGVEMKDFIWKMDIFLSDSPKHLNKTEKQEMQSFKSRTQM